MKTLGKQKVSTPDNIPGATSSINDHLVHNVSIVKGLLTVASASSLVIGILMLFALTMLHLLIKLSKTACQC